METYLNYQYIISSLVYSMLGIGILFTAFWVIEMVTPENLWKENIPEKNR